MDKVIVVIFGIVVGLFIMSALTDKEHSDRLTALESRCVPIEQAGSFNSDAIWESSQPLGGGALIHYE